MFMRYLHYSRIDFFYSYFFSQQKGSFTYRAEEIVNLEHIYKSIHACPKAKGIKGKKVQVLLQLSERKERKPHKFI